MTKNSMQGVLRTQLENKDITVKTMVVQDLIWDGYSECRLFTNNGEVYSAVFVEDEKVTDFVIAPKQETK